MYIPKGKLDPNIYYTNGGEYVLSTTRTEYKGYYHKDLMGGVWTDKEHSVDSIKLIPPPLVPEAPSNVNLRNRESSAYYRISLKSNKPTPKQVVVPVSDALPPTQEEYQQTYFTRYILQYKLATKPVYIEVNKNTYYSILNATESNYYNMVEVLWKIYGPLYDKKENGILIQGGVIDSNLRSIQEASKKISGIGNYLNDLLLYYKQ